MAMALAMAVRKDWPMRAGAALTSMSFAATAAPASRGMLALRVRAMLQEKTAFKLRSLETHGTVYYLSPFTMILFLALPCLPYQCLCVRHICSLVWWLPPYYS